MNLIFIFIEYSLYKSINISDSANGMEILLEHSLGMIRGLLTDPAFFGKYPENVSTIWIYLKWWTETAELYWPLIGSK